jgi:hypothetical protein
MDSETRMTLSEVVAPPIITPNADTPRLKLLLSYYYFKNYPVDDWMRSFVNPVQGFADSGAYSAHSRGDPLKVEEYIDWLHKWKHLFDHYAALDVKGDQNLGLKNLAKMEQAGLKPIPVFHGGEPWSVLKDFVQHYPYVALGGIVGASAGTLNALMRWCLECFRIAEGKSVFHIFGVTTPKFLWSLPWYSVDSSSWSAGFRYGAVAIYVRKEKRVIYLRNVKREPGHREKWEEVRNDVARHGQNILDFMHHDIRSNVRYASMGASAFQLMAQHIRQTRPEVPWPTDESPNSRPFSASPGPHLYLGAQGLPINPKTGMKGRAWYEVEALKYLDANLEILW